MNPVCECHGSKAGPQMTRPSLKYHIGLCFSLYKSNKRLPLWKGTLTLWDWQYRQGENTEGSSGEISAGSICVLTPQRWILAQETLLRQNQKIKQTENPRTEQLKRKGWTMAFTPAFRGKHSSLIPITTRVHLLHPQVSTPSCSFMVLPFSPTDYFGFCLK